MNLYKEDGEQPIAPANMQDENGYKGSVPPPSGNSDSGIQLSAPTAPKLDPIVPPYQPPNSDAGGLSTTVNGVAPTLSTISPSSPLPSSSAAPPMAMPITGYETPYNVNPTGAAPTAINPATGTPATIAPTGSAPTPLNPSSSGETTDLMSALTKRAMAGLNGGTAPIASGSSGAVTSLTDRLQQEALRQLEQPTVYDDDLFKSAAAMMKRGVNENYDVANEALTGELADRGINYSTIAGGRFLDLNTRRAQSLSDVDTNLLRERASALAAGRTAAFNNTRGVLGDRYSMERGDRDEARGERDFGVNQANNATNLARYVLGDRLNLERGNRDEARVERSYADNFERSNRDELRGERAYSDSFARDARDEARGERAYADNYGANQRAEQRVERGYTDSLSDKARQQAIELGLLDQQYTDKNDAAFEDLLTRLYGYGSDERGSTLLGSAAGNYGDAASGYARDASGNEDDMASMAKLLMEYFYPQPTTTAKP